VPASLSAPTLIAGTRTEYSVGL